MGFKLFHSLKTEKYFPKILVTAIVCYYYKTAFWPLTYVFITSYIVLVILFIINFKWKIRLLSFIHEFKVPVILALIFIIAFIVNGQFSNSVVKKDILLILVLFSLYYFLYWCYNVLKIKIQKTYLLNLIIFITAVISVLNLITQFNISLLDPETLEKMNISSGSSVATDYNFFSLFLLFGLILLNFKGIRSAPLHSYSMWVTSSLNLIIIINILLSASKRGLFALIIFTLIFIIYAMVFPSYGFVLNKFLKRVASFILFIVLLIFFGIIIYQIIPRQKVGNALYRYANLAGYNNYISIEKFLWEREFEIPKDNKQVIDSTTFIKYLKYWNSYSAPGTVLEPADSPYGRAIKIIRVKGDNEGFSLCYDGPKILYYSNHTYEISFKIKFLKGNFNSFSIGWWLNEIDKGISNSSNLEKDTVSLGNGWYSCISKYTFIDSHIGIIGFINFVKDQSEFIISDFELFDLDYDSKIT